MNLKEMVEKINPDVNKYVNNIFSRVDDAIKNFDWESLSKNSFVWRGVFAYGLTVSDNVEIACCSDNHRKYIYITEWAFKELILNKKLCTFPYSEVKDCLPLMVEKGIIANISMNDTGSLFIGIWLE